MADEPARWHPPTEIVPASAGPNALLFLLVQLTAGVVAIPIFMRFGPRRPRSFEATGNISRIYQAEVAYFNESAGRGAGRFLSARPTPAPAPTATRYPADPSLWARDPAWNALGFAPAGSHRYQYQVTATQAGGEWSFTVTAIGDLDGDGVFSTFSRSAHTQAGEIEGTRIEITNELE